MSYALTFQNFISIITSLDLHIFLKGSTISLLTSWADIWGHLTLLHQKAVVLQLSFQRPIE